MVKLIAWDLQCRKVGLYYLSETKPTVIGRADYNEVIIPDVAVSKEHAVIIPYKNSFYIGDFGSSNGTFYPFSEKNPTNSKKLESLIERIKIERKPINKNTLRGKLNRTDFIERLLNEELIKILKIEEAFFIPIKHTFFISRYE